MTDNNCDRTTPPLLRESRQQTALACWRTSTGINFTIISVIISLSFLFQDAFHVISNRNKNIWEEFDTKIPDNSFNVIRICWVSNIWNKSDTKIPDNSQLLSLLCCWCIDATWWRGSVVITSVFNWRSTPDLWLTCDHFVGKVSAINQPTRPTQPSIPLRSVNE